MQVPRTTLTAVFLVGAFATQAVAQSSDRLSATATRLAGKPVTVESGIPKGGRRGETWVDEARIVIRPRIWKTLSAIPRYDYATTPWAVGTFAHEVGHIVRGMDENAAACWANPNMYRVARSLGFGPHRAKVVARLARQDQIAYCEPS